MSKSKLFLVIGGVLVLLTLALIAFLMYQVFSVGITRGIDNKFGDQHLKTSVSLVEMHRLRFGNYPAKLSELKYVGDWDRIALGSVNYIVNEDRTKYCIDVARGWATKPDFERPSEFWQNTGYDPSLCK